MAIGTRNDRHADFWVHGFGGRLSLPSSKAHVSFSGVSPIAALWYRTANAFVQVGAGHFAQTCSDIALTVPLGVQLLQQSDSCCI